MKLSKLSIATIFSVFVLSTTAFAAQGLIISDRTLVPVRGVFEELGFNVDWEESTSTVSISNELHTITIVKDETEFVADGTNYTSDVPAQIVDGHLYLPLRSIGDSIGAETSWDSDTKTAHIKLGDKESYVSCDNDNTTDEFPTEEDNVLKMSNNFAVTRVGGYRRR